MTFLHKECLFLFWSLLSGLEVLFLVMTNWALHVLYLPRQSGRATHSLGRNTMALVPFAFSLLLVRLPLPRLADDHRSYDYVQ